MNQIFRTTIKDLISRNKFFECFVCYEQFNSGVHYPMQVCRNHHYMCDQCVKSRAFKSKAKNQYKCGLCSVQIKISEIKRNSFILSIKEFFEGLIEREELARDRYRQYMENQEKIVEILLEENQNILKESKEKGQEVQKIKSEVERFKKISEQKSVAIQKLHQKQKPVHMKKYEVSEDEQQQFLKLSGQKANHKPLINPTNSIFRSSLFGSSMKIDNESLQQKPQPQPELQQQFIPNPAFSQIYHQGTNSMALLKPESKLSQLMKRSKKMKENLINEEHQSKIRLKESLMELQAHKKYIDQCQENEDNDGDDGDNQGENQRKQPQKKVHIEGHNQGAQQPQQQIQNAMKPRKSWFFHLHQ